MQLLPKDPLRLSTQFRVGRGVKRVYTDKNRHLIFEMTDGDTIDLGVLEATVTKDSLQAALGYLPADPGSFVPKTGGTFTGDVGFKGQIAFEPTAEGKSAPYLEGATDADGVPQLNVMGTEGDEPVRVYGVSEPKQGADAAPKSYVDRAATQLGLASGTVGKVPMVKELNEDGSIKAWELGDGGKGKDGSPGIVISSAQPTDPNHPVWIDPDGDASAIPWVPQPATAAVGQIVKVKAVDSEGRITETEAVAMPSGGGGETWELINEVTLSEAAMSVVFDKDKNGAAFALRRFAVVGVTKGANASTSGGTICINTANSADDRYSIVPPTTGHGALKGDQIRYWHAAAESIAAKGWRWYLTDADNTARVKGVSIGTAFSKVTDKVPAVATYLALWSRTNGAAFAAGSKITLYGVRA